MTQALLRLAEVVTTSIGALDSDMHGQQVVVAGMLQRARRHITKKGDEMAFVTLEGLDGTCDVVVFPRVWSHTRHLWQPEQVLVVGGRIDASRRDEPSLLCDWVKTPDEIRVAADDVSVGAVGPAPGPAPAPPPAAARQHRTASTARPARPPRKILVTLSRSGRQAQDVKMLHQVHDLLVQHSGRDRFVIYLVGGAAKPVELAFPNDRTHYCPELAVELAAVAGTDAVRVESLQ